MHFDDGLGPLVQLPEDADGQRAVAGYELWRLLEQDEDLAETHRLLYVATTRAADYLLLSSGMTTLGDTNGTWMQLLARRFDLQRGTLIGEIPLEEPRPQVRVTTEKPAGRPNSAARGPRVDWDRVLADAEDARSEHAAALPAVDRVGVDVSARRQYSFSRLTGGLYRPSAPADEATLLASAIPRTADSSDPRALGTLAHSVLANIDFAAPGSWQQQVSRAAERQLLGTASPEAVEAARLIERFLVSPRAGELARARTSLVEAEFLLAWPLGSDTDARTLLTGYIDRLYQDAAGRWHVLDFKTNRVSADNVASVAAGYEMQMLVYALAVEQTLGTEPASLILHFLRTGEEHAFAWNAAGAGAPSSKSTPPLPRPPWQSRKRVATGRLIRPAMPPYNRAVGWRVARQRRSGRSISFAPSWR